MYAQTSLICLIMCTKGIHGWVSIDTLHWHLDCYSMNILIDMQSTLSRPLIISGLVVGWVSTDSCIDQKLVNFWLRCPQSLDWVLIKLLIKRINQQSPAVAVNTHDPVCLQKRLPSLSLRFSISLLIKLVTTLFQMAPLKLHCKVYKILKACRTSNLGYLANAQCM